MQRAINHLMGNNMGATDGEIGKVEDFYFDDETWTIRYLIVNTGSWLFGRKVLISSKSLARQAWESGIFPVNLTKEQVRHSPDIDTEKPVSRQQEEQLALHYQWQSYWSTGFYPGGVWGVVTPAPGIEPRSARELNKLKVSKDDNHLRSVLQVTGYRIHTSDGDIGHVDDFIVDDQTWQISYLVVDTHHWFGGKRVLVGVKHIKDVQWDSAEVLVDITVDAIKNSAPIDMWDYIIPEGDKAEYQEQIFVPGAMERQI